MIRRHNAGQPKVQIVLCAQKAGRLTVYLRLVLLKPHNFKDGVQPGWKTAAGGRVPFRLVNLLKEAFRLLFTPAVRPDGAAFHQQPAIRGHRHRAQAVARAGDRQHVGGINAGRFKQQPRAVHNAAPPVVRALLVKLFAGIRRFYGGELAGAQLPLLRIQAGFCAARSQIIGEDKLHDVSSLNRRRLPPFPH